VNKKLLKRTKMSVTETNIISNPNLIKLPQCEPFASDLYPNVNLVTESIDFSVSQDIPSDLMLKYSFVPIYEHDGFLWLAMSDPMDVIVQDILRMYFKRPLRFASASAAQITSVIEKSESSQKVMNEAGEALRIQVLREDDLEEELDLENCNDK
jgi:type IV pilus assembly protein PilB